MGNITEDKIVSMRTRMCKYLSTLTEEEKQNNIEVLFSYNERGKIQHTIGRFWRNTSKHWVGTIDGIFDFDFYESHDIIAFMPLKNIDSILETKWINFDDYA